jgi:hypothetical protein
VSLVVGRQKCRGHQESDLVAVFLFEPDEKLGEPRAAQFAARVYQLVAAAECFWR